MRLAATQFSLKYKAYEIYLSGCKGTCKGCCNPELKNFDYGEKIDNKTIISIVSKIKEFDLLIDNIWILGGDPVDNEVYLVSKFLKTLKFNTKKKIWLWTRYDLNSISNYIKQHCDYIKSGEYIPELKTNSNYQYGIKLETSNQKIFKLGVDY